MTIIPDEEIKRQDKFNLAPMVDFLFIVVALFATLAVAKSALYDSELSLVKLRPNREDQPVPTYDPTCMVILAVTEKGEYKWISEFNEFMMTDVASIQQELERQQKLGLLPKERALTRVLLHIDERAEWEPIAELIFGVRKAGFKIHPVYKPEKSV